MFLFNQNALHSQQYGNGKFKWLAMGNIHRTYLFIRKRQEGEDLDDLDLYHIQENEALNVYSFQTGMPLFQDYPLEDDPEIDQPDRETVDFPEEEEIDFDEDLEEIDEDEDVEEFDIETDSDIDKEAG